MKITKLEHSGIVVEEDGQKLVFDPVQFTKVLPELENVVAIVITHQHGDHLQPERLQELVARNPQAKILAVSDAEIALPNVQTVEAGDEVEVGAFNLKIFGHDHAEIVPGEVPCRNIGMVVNDRLINPGDSFDMPLTAVEDAILLVPSAAPWLKLAESMDYIERMRPALVIPVHDAVLSEFGKQIQFAWLMKACEKVDAKFVGLMAGDEIEA